MYNIKANDVTVTSDSNNAVYGSFVVTGENCVIKNITITNKGDKKQEDGTTPNTAVRNGINAACSKLTVTNCTFNNNNSENGIKNGLSIWPTNENVTYNISENTFIGFKTSVSGYASTAITIAGGVSKPQVIEGHGTSVLAKMTDEQDRAIIDGNTFNDCKGDYCREDWTNGNKVYCKSISNGDNLALEYAADSAKYYVTNNIERKSNATVKSGTILEIASGKTMSLVGGAELTVNGEVTGTITGKDATSKLIIGESGKYGSLEKGTYLWMNDSWTKVNDGITMGDGLVENDGKLSTSFIWSSSENIGTESSVETINGLSYYKDGSYLRLQVKKDDKVVAFDKVFITANDHTDQSKCGVALKTTTIKGTKVGEPKYNDLDGSVREKADWTAAKGYESIDYKGTDLDNNENSKYIFYGVRQGGETTELKKSRTVGFAAGDVREIELVLNPLENLDNGTYTVTIQSMKQENCSTDESDKKLGNEITYTFTVTNKVITVNNK